MTSYVVIKSLTRFLKCACYSICKVDENFGRNTHFRYFFFSVDLVVFGSCGKVQVSFAVSVSNTHSVNLVFARSSIETEINGTIR